MCGKTIGWCNGTLPRKAFYLMVGGGVVSWVMERTTYIDEHRVPTTPNYQLELSGIFGSRTLLNILIDFLNLIMDREKN